MAARSTMTPRGGETDSDFEIFVADALRGGGYEVVYQVGVENFRIDLGVRHENCPVGFIAGIECDGAPYHTGLSVRDRDHIRQTILENLGWNIYRVWSTDWFADPARETAKLLAWLDRVRERVASDLGDQPIIDVVKPKPKVAPQPPLLPIPPIPTPPGSVLPVEKVATESDIELGKIGLDGGAAGPREPFGRKIYDKEGCQGYEAVRGRLYDVFKDQHFLGEVEVIKRATATPRLYSGGSVVTAQSEYEGRIESTGDCFRSFDLYAAVREVALRATENA